MKRDTLIYRFILSLTALLAFTTWSGCTHNNGDIGDWFGTWRVESMTIDGEPAPDYAPPYMIWKFQSSVVQMMTPPGDDHFYPIHTGTWHEEDGMLYLDFTWGQGVEQVSHLPAKCELTILQLSSRRIELQYDSTDGKTYIYKLKKWG